MREHVPELERLVDHQLDQVRDLLGDGDDAKLAEANAVVNQALQLQPAHVEAWLLKGQIASAMGDDLAALAAVEMALATARPPEAMYWRGAVLGDLGRHREALDSIEAALRGVGDEPHWLLEELFHEKITVLDALGLADAARAARAEGLARCPGSALLRAALAPAGLPRARGTLTLLRGGAR